MTSCFGGVGVERFVHNHVPDAGTAVGAYMRATTNGRAVGVWAP